MDLVDPVAQISNVSPFITIYPYVKPMENVWLVILTPNATTTSQIRLSAAQLQVLAYAQVQVNVKIQICLSALSLEFAALA